MKIALLGSGGIGLAMAALACRDGHEASIWSPSGKGTAALKEGTPLTVTGAFQGTFHLHIAASCEEAMRGADCVVFALPAYAHRTVMEVAAKHVEPAQVLIVSSQYSLSSLYLRALLDERGISSPVIAWGTTLLMAGVVSPAEIKVFSIRDRVDIATIPASALAAGVTACQALFGDRFLPRQSAIAIELSNINPPVHVANALCNFTRMEKAEHWDHYGSLTPSVARFIEKLDEERLRIAEAFDVEVKTIHQHMSFTFGKPLMPLEMAAEQASARGGPAGPKSLKTRWIHEDIPFGIVPVIALADVAGLHVPLYQAGYKIFCALMDRRFEADNDLLRRLDLQNHSVKSLNERVS